MTFGRSGDVADDDLRQALINTVTDLLRPRRPE
jgi:hypothetical protein